MAGKFIEVKEQKTSFLPQERWRIMKNIFLISIAFMVAFTAVMGTNNLQSSMYADGSLGTSTLAAAYGSYILGNLILPMFVIRWLGCKWTMAVAFLIYSPYIAAQFYPRIYTLIPAGLVIGFGGGPLWCAKCTYLTVAAEAYASISDVKLEVLITRFFGFFFMFTQLAQVWGNLISSSILSSDMGSHPKNVTVNSTIIAEMCGAQFCGISNAPTENPNLAPPPVESIRMMGGIYLACIGVAFLIVAIGVDSLTRYDKGRSEKVKKQSSLEMLIVSVRLFKEKLQILIIPITLFVGIEQAFLYADFSMAFVSCAGGISDIGYVMICYGVSNALGAVLTGMIVKVTGRTPVMAFVFIVHAVVIIVLLLWKPSSQQNFVFFVISGLWGVCDSVWLVQLSALSGLLFPGREEAAFSNFRLWEATGAVTAYIYTPYICVDMKLYILLGMLFLGGIGYAAIVRTGVTNTNTKANTKEFELVATNEDDAQP